MAAAGFNTVSIYTHWGLVQPDPHGRLDWDGFRALEPFFDAAQRAGLWVIVRPGPYINAETTAGGLPAWVTKLDAPLRERNPTYDAAWRPYMDSVARIVTPYQYDNGGPVVRRRSASSRLIRADRRPTRK